MSDQTETETDAIEEVQHEMGPVLATIAAPIYAMYRNIDNAVTGRPLDVTDPKRMQLAIQEASDLVSFARIYIADTINSGQARGDVDVNALKVAEDELRAAIKKKVDKQ